MVVRVKETAKKCAKKCDAGAKLFCLLKCFVDDFFFFLHLKHLGGGGG